MIKKALVTVGGLGLLSLLFFGRDAASYIRTSAGWVKDSVKSSVPIEFEIERARRMVKNLIPDIRRNMHVIAQEEVEVERLDKQITQTTATLEKDRAEMLRLKTDLATAQPVYQYAGRTYTVQAVKVDLANRFERYKTNDATLASLRDIQAARRKSLDAARQKLEGMLVAKRQLEVDVVNLEARFKLVEVAQTTCDFNIDDSELGRVKELITEVRTRLNVAERLVNTQGELHEEIPLSAPQSENIIDQITEYFGAEKDGAKVAEAHASPAH
jgi:hypothetical protein